MKETEDEQRTAEDKAFIDKLFNYFDSESHRNIPFSKLSQFFEKIFDPVEPLLNGDVEASVTLLARETKRRLQDYMVGCSPIHRKEVPTTTDPELTFKPKLFKSNRENMVKNLIEFSNSFNFLIFSNRRKNLQQSGIIYYIIELRKQRKK